MATIEKYPNLVVEVAESFEYVDSDLPTASWYDTYEIRPGVYPVEWVNINGTRWNPDPAAKTPGYLANTGPYYAKVTYSAIHRKSYRESRLLSEVRGSHVAVNDVTTVVRTAYAYTARAGEAAMYGIENGARVPRAVFREVPARDETVQVVTQ